MKALTGVQTININNVNWENNKNKKEQGFPHSLVI
jgi:hypothetical protein